MKNKFKSFLFGALRFLPFAACAVFMVMYLFAGKEFTTEEILNYTPDNKPLAALFMVLLYALKSITVFFPVSVLNIANGFLFEPFHALIVNSVGVIVEFSVPYWIGRLTGKNLAQRLMERNKKIVEFMERHTVPAFFKSFIVRFIYVIPRDSVSRYLGATKSPFGFYLLGSYIGALPSMITTTLLGISITSPKSPMFLNSIIATVAIAIISILIYRQWVKRSTNNEEKEKNEC